MKRDFERLEKENVELRDQVAKGESRVAKFKEALKTFTRCAVEKYTEGFYLTRPQLLGRNSNADTSRLNAYKEVDVHPSWCSEVFLRGDLTDLSQPLS